jgi:formiminotetrahydrofolate cyclodeaminase
MTALNRGGDSFIDRSLPMFCQHVALPDLPSPTGGAVAGVTGALLASLSELVLRVTVNHLPAHQRTDDANEWKDLIAAMEEFRRKLLAYSEEDIYEVEKLAHGQRESCVRKQIAALAKISSHLVKVLRSLEQVADRLHPSVLADARAVAHLGKGAADAIYEIEIANIRMHGDGDSVLLQRIAMWREDAHLAVDGILAKTNLIV